MLLHRKWKDIPYISNTKLGVSLPHNDLAWGRSNSLYNLIVEGHLLSASLAHPCNVQFELRTFWHQVWVDQFPKTSIQTWYSSFCLLVVTYHSFNEVWPEADASKCQCSQDDQSPLGDPFGKWHIVVSCFSFLHERVWKVQQHKFMQMFYNSVRKCHNSCDERTENEEQRC